MVTSTSWISRTRLSVAYLWVSPLSAVGAALAVLGLVLGAQAAWRAGVWEVSGGRIGQALSRWRCPFVAITFGHVVLALDAPTMASLSAHERVHVRQMERWGVLFPLLYVGASVWAWLHGGHFYFDNCFEREAYAA